MPPPRRAFGGDSDSGSDSEGGRRQSHGRTEAVVGFSSRGALSGRPSPPRAGPKTVPLQGDSDWVAARKRRLNLERHAAELGSLTSMRRPGQLGPAPPRDGAASTASSTRIGDEPQLVGLVKRAPRSPPRTREEEEEREIEALQAAAAAAAAGTGAGDATPPAARAGPTPPPDLDAEARAALLSGAGIESAQSGSERVIALDEAAATRADVATRPDEPTLDDYKAMPVSEIGAAMLRGMGWREGQGGGRNHQGPIHAPEVKKRAALLGLGAKERKVDDATPARGKGKPPPRPDRRYVPVVQRGSGASGSSTPQHRAVVDSRSSSPGSSRRRDERDGERDRYRGKERDSDRYRDRDDGRDRERDRERRRAEGDDRDRRRDSDRDRERYRERERDDARSGRSERDRTRERSPRSDRDRESKRRRHEDDSRRDYDDRYRREGGSRENGERRERESAGRYERDERGESSRRHG